MRCGLFAGLAGAMPVLVYRTSVAAALACCDPLVSAYEMGDFLNGSEAYGIVRRADRRHDLRRSWSPFAVGRGRRAVPDRPVPARPPTPGCSALLVVVLCPLSQLAASLLLPRADARAPALRRLDSYLLTGPAWLWLLWSFVL